MGENAGVGRVAVGGCGWLWVDPGDRRGGHGICGDHCRFCLFDQGRAGAVVFAAKWACDDGRRGWLGVVMTMTLTLTMIMTMTMMVMGGAGQQMYGIKYVE